MGMYVEKSMVRTQNKDLEGTKCSSSYVYYFQMADGRKYLVQQAVLSKLQRDPEWKEEQYFLHNW